jgi:hypothetical protein
MRVRLALQVGMTVACATLVACGSAAVSTPPDTGVQPCQDDQDCQLGYACTGGYCQPSIPADAGPDAPQTPKMMVSPTLLDFGNAYIGGEFTKTYTIGNVGTAPLTVTAQNLVEDVTVGAFIMQSKPVPFTIDVAGSETVTVILRPNDSNLPTGKIIIHSDDPDPTSGSATVDLISRSKGSPNLGICAHAPGSPDCMVSAGNAIIDYGSVSYGTSLERLVDLTNVGDGNLPLQLTDIYLSAPAHFGMSLFSLEDDPANPGQYLEHAATLPFYLSVGDPTASPPLPPTKLRVHVVFTAVGIDGDLPNVSLMVKDADTATPTSVPVTGSINGCIPVATDAGVPDGGADPLTDPNNCGTCGHKCVVAHGTAGCDNGSCTVASCDLGWEDCNNNPSDGCEADLNNDPDSCGVCGKVCSNINMLTRTCGSGVCNGTCATGFEDCNGNKQTDGCESQLAVDPNNCSQCGKACSHNNMGTVTCNGGVCNGTCAAGYDDCNGNKQTDGCETNLKTDAVHCGSCATNCNNLAHPNAATVQCSNGSCAVATCASGWYDQDAVFSNGCECQADPIGNTCSAATDLGSLGVGNTATFNSYNLTPSPSDQDWFKVTFTTNGSCNFHPKVAVSSTFGSIYVRVFTDCSSGTVGCTEGTSGAASLKTWEVTYSATCDPNNGPIDPDGSPANYQGSFLNGELPAALTFYVQVYATASTTTCAPYVLTISN